MGFCGTIEYGKGYISAPKPALTEIIPQYQVSIPVRLAQCSLPYKWCSYRYHFRPPDSSSDGIAFAVKAGHLKRLLMNCREISFPARDS